jgi:haloacetate dehalogenase
VAPLLAGKHMVVCPDLRGFGRLSKPADTPDHGLVETGQVARLHRPHGHLGFERFAIVGHDRGSYTAFRTAMDDPDRITRLALLDGVPILEALERCGARFAQAWRHCFFFAQKDKPEHAILADPDACTPIILSAWARRTTPTTARPSTTPPPSMA